MFPVGYEEEINVIIMIGATWNTRSLGHPGGKQAIADFIFDDKVESLVFRKPKRKKLILAILITSLVITALIGFPSLLKELRVVF